jgi:hypothetical protein
MICDRCYQPLDQGEHGLYRCPLVPRRAAVVRPDSIPGGLVIEHGLCHEDGTPRRYDSQSEIDRECARRGMMRWTDLHTEDRTRPARERMDWQRSGEAARLAKQHAERARDERGRR